MNLLRILVASILFAFHFSAYSQVATLSTPTSGVNDFLLSTDDFAVQRRVVTDVEQSTGRKVFVFQDPDAAGSTNRNIICKIYNADHSSPTTFTVNSITTGDQIYPTIKVNQQDGSFVVAWASWILNTNSADINKYDIYAKKFYFDNTAAGVAANDLLINEFINERQINPILAYDYNLGEIVVGWLDQDARDKRAANGTTAIETDYGSYARRINNTGATLAIIAGAGDFKINHQQSVNHQTINAIEISPVKGELITLCSSIGYRLITPPSTYNTDYDVVRAVFKRDAINNFSIVPVETIVHYEANNNQNHGHITFNSISGDYAVGFTTTAADNDCKIKIFNKDHVEVKGEQVVQTIASVHQLAPKIIWDEAAHVLMCFYWHATSSATNVRYQLYDEDLTAIGTEGIAESYNLKYYYAGGYNVAYAKETKKVHIVFDEYQANNNANSKARYVRLQLNHASSGSLDCGNSVCTEDNSNPKNWVLERDFDETGNVTGESKVYFDNLGRELQVQTRNSVDNKIIVTASIYDGEGNPAIKTLPAAISDNCMCYQPRFVIEHSSGEVYSTAHFDKEITTSNVTGEVNNPRTVSSSEPSTLGWYYGANDVEATIPYASKPYTRQWQSKIGNFSKFSKPGESFKMGAGHESINVTVPILWELNHYLMWKPSFPASSGNTYPNNFMLKGTKVISVDGNKNEQVSFYDKDGKILATCLSGSIDGVNQSSLRNSSAMTIQEYLDIHIPEGFGTSLVISGTYLTYDIATGLQVNSLEQPGFYRIVGNGCTINYNLNYYNFTYYYYNDAGRLIATLSPNQTKGFSTTVPVASTTTTYIFNSLGWILSNTSPDEGKIEYLYRKDGQVAFSQNALQSASNKFSYSFYDELGRNIESGEATSSSGYRFQNHLSQPATGTGTSVLGILENSNNSFPAAGKVSPIITCYSEVPSWLSSSSPTGRNQNNLRGRVAVTARLDDVYILSTTFYSYDALGNIEWSSQRLHTTDNSSLPYKSIDYEYDLSGNLLKSIYQKNIIAERFDHRYSYDALKRLSNVTTSRAGGAMVQQSKYIYYTHGPLKRTEVGNKLQGIDFAYTAFGSLKSINDATGKDPGNDGILAPNLNFQKDIFGENLEYYEGDNIGLTKAEGNFNTNNLGTTFPEQFTGLIRSAKFNTRLGTSMGTASTYVYNYDQKEQLTKATYGTYSPTTREFTSADDNQYLVYNISYDDNGNLLSMYRMDQEGYRDKHTEQLFYTIAAGKNQLTQTRYTSPTGTVNRSFTYNQIGQLTAKSTAVVGETSQYFDYDIYGNVTAVYSNSAKTQILAKFLYDERGFRIRKAENSIYTWYVRDINGKLVSTYESTFAVPSTFTQKELPIYGLDKIGVFTTSGVGYNYELKDHLGNIRAVISSDNPARILSYSDYYPHGSPLPGRHLVNSPTYRFGYQGEYAEADIETGYNNSTVYNSFELRMYDPVLGRFFSPDPYGEFHSPYIGMGNNPINFVDPDGGKILPYNQVAESMGIDVTLAARAGLDYMKISSAPFMWKDVVINAPKSLNLNVISFVNTASTILDKAGNTVPRTTYSGEYVDPFLFLLDLNFGGNLSGAFPSDPRYVGGSGPLPGIRGLAAKGGVEITKHAALRMTERGITQKMVETGISKGTKYLNPKNGTFNYVLKNGFASGKDLLIGVSPQTGKVTTVLRGNNLVNQRFIPR